MDSFPLSDLNWAQKYICRIKTAAKILEEPCTAHEESTSSSSEHFSERRRFSFLEAFELLFIAESDGFIQNDR